MTAERARRELGWTPQHTAVEAAAAALEGMRRGSGTPSPILRRRELHEDLLRALREGPPSYRHLP